MAEGILERVVQRRGTNVEEGPHRGPVPAHLLFLVHALGHDLAWQNAARPERESGWYARRPADSRSSDSAAASDFRGFVRRLLL